MEEHLRSASLSPRWISNTCDTSRAWHFGHLWFVTVKSKTFDLWMGPGQRGDDTICMYACPPHPFHWNLLLLLYLDESREYPVPKYFYFPPLIFLLFIFFPLFLFFSVQLHNDCVVALADPNIKKIYLYSWPPTDISVGNSLARELEG